MSRFYKLLIVILLTLVFGQVSAQTHIIEADTLRPITLKGDSAMRVRKIFRLDTIRDRIYIDTVAHKYITIDSARSTKHISNLIAKNLFKEVSPTVHIYIDSALQKVTKFNKYEGMIIDSIFIDRRNVFHSSNSGSGLEQWLRRTANLSHIKTRESAIKRYLLFSKGDRVTPEDFIRSEAYLHDAKNLAKARIEIIPTENNRVNVYIETSDNWSITAQLNYRVTNNGKLTITDHNFLGTGNRFDVSEYFNVKNREWLKATEVKYFIPNFLGKFIEVNVGAGSGKNFFSLIAAADKFFVFPNDWAGGARYERRKEESHIGIEDIFTLQDKERVNLWYGKSINISKKWGDNLYYAFKGERVRFFQRPYHTAVYSPYFHDYIDALGAFGFYKEKFYRGNMIYGYGTTESIPYGYKVEFIGGYRWGEYETRPYFGTNLSIGNMIPIGYISADISFGTYVGGHHARQTKIDIGMLYFTKLQSFSNGVNVRQFLKFNYTSNLDKLHGFGESLNFPNNNRLNSSSGDAHGSTRLRVNPETIFFTPFHISGFKFAIFGFTDFGTIGYSSNPFHNSFFANAGAGVRIRNESLIFKTIQFKLVVALKGDKNFRNNLFYLNSEQPLRANRYIPTEPKVIELH